MSNLSLSDSFNLFPANPASHIIRFERMPETSFVVQEVNLPGVSANPAKINAPGLVVRHGPDRLNYEPLTVSFVVDEEFRTHRELHRWLVGMTGGEDRTLLTHEFLQTHRDYIWPDNSSVSQRFSQLQSTTAGLTIVNEAKIPLLRVVFYNLYVTSLGPVQFSITQDPINVMSSTATFEYDFYSIVEIRRR